MSAPASSSHAAAVRPLVRLLRDYFYSRGQVAVSVLLVTVVASTVLVIPWVLMVAIDAIVQHGGVAAGTFHEAFSRVLAMAGIMAVAVIVQYFARSGLARVENRVMYEGAARLRSELYGRLQAQPLNYHTQRRVGNLLTYLVTDIPTVQDMSLELISEIPFNAVTLVGLLSAMLLLNPMLALTIAVLLVATFALAFHLGRGGMASQAQAMDAAAALASRVQESFSGIRAIQSFGAAAGERAGVDAMAGHHAKELAAAGDVRASVTPFFGVAEFGGILIVMVIGGWCALRGSLTPGGLVAFLAYMEMAAEPISRIAVLLPKAQKGMVAAGRLATLLAETELPTAPLGTARPVNIAGEIRVEALRFVYPGEKAALRGLDFLVRPGERVAVIGPNAAGKSTLFDVLLKLQTPTEGRVTIDGTDLQTISPEAWCQLIGVIPQDTCLLNRTIAENIALGSAKIDDVRGAAQLAGVDDAIRHLPKGYDTLPGERGVRLSGGERQRIAIARLFLRDPRIVLLDEPTAALDLGSEADLLPPLRRLCSGRTAFIVSHRTAILEEVDEVLLLADGQQIAFGAPFAVWTAFPQYRALFPAAWATAPQPVESQKPKNG